MNEATDKLSRLHRSHAARGRCPSADALGRLAAGRTWPWQRAGIVAHLGECCDCADDYRALRAAAPGIARALTEVEQPRTSASTFLSGGALAAAMVGAVALGVVLIVDRPTSENAATETGLLFASQFEPGAGDQRSDAREDRLFGSDFGEPNAAERRRNG
jgi:hypothetical protein